VRTHSVLDEAGTGLSRDGAGRWGVPVAVLVAVAMAAGVSAALTADRIHAGTAAAGGGAVTVPAAQAVTSLAAPGGAAGPAKARG
jgi:hypothetical protein